MAEQLTERQAQAIANGIRSGRIAGPDKDRAMSLLRTFRETTPSQTASAAPDGTQPPPGADVQAQPPVEAPAAAPAEQDATENLPSTVKFAGLDTGIDMPESVGRFLVGAGKEMNDVVTGVQQLFSDDPEMEGRKAEAEQQIFNALDDQGIGAEDFGQFLSDGLMMALPGGVVAKVGVKSVPVAGAIGAALVDGAKASEGADLQDERGMEALTSGGGALVGGAVTKKVADVISHPVRTVLNSVSLGMANSRVDRLWQGLFNKGRNAYLKDQRANVIRDQGRTDLGLANRQAREEMAKANRDSARTLIERDVAPVLQELTRQGKADFMRAGVQRLNAKLADAAKAQNPEIQMKAAWDEVFGAIAPAMMKRGPKDGGYGREWGNRMETMGNILKNHSDKYSADTITALARAAVNESASKTDRALLALGKQGAAEPALLKLIGATGAVGGQQAASQ